MHEIKTRFALNRFVGLEFFQPSGIVLITTMSREGGLNIAPKSQVTAVGRNNFWGFSCCEGHHTLQNVVAQGEFVVNIPGPSLIEQISAAAGRLEGASDEITGVGLTPIPSRAVSVPSVGECSVHLECVKHQVIEDLGGDVFVIGRVVAAVGEVGGADPESLSERPVLTYLFPGHYTLIKSALRFAFPPDYKE